MRKYTIFGILLLCLSCVTWRLERGLSPYFREWYKKHAIIMEYPVPKDIDPKQPMERIYWLKLSGELKKKYISMFWKIRELGMDDEFKHRVAVANFCFRGEGIDGFRTDRGQVMLLCGQPDYREFKDQYGNIYQEGEEQWGYAKQKDKRWFQLWGYWWGRGGFLQNLQWIFFEYDDFDHWTYRPTFDGMEREFFEYWRWRMAPTSEGYQLWQKAIQK